MSTYGWMLRSCWGWSFWPCTIPNQCQTRMTVDLLVVWLEGSICLRSSTSTNLIKPGFDLCGFSVTHWGILGSNGMLATKPYKWWLGHQVLPKKTWWELLTYWEDPICIHLLTKVLRVPAGICVTLVGSASHWARKHRWVSDDMRRLIAIWDGPAANSCRAWHGLSSTRSQQINGLDRLMMFQTWQAKDAYGVLWSCSSFFFYLFVCHICLIERLSAHHIVHSSTGVFLDGWGVNCQPLRDFSTSTSWLEQPLRRTWIFINYVRVSDYTVAKFWLGSEADL